MKYELTQEKITISGLVLHRIRALRDIKSWDVRAGDLGGYIEKADNLSQDGDAWVYGNARVYGDARVCGDARVYGNAVVCGDTWVDGNAQVYGDAKVYGDTRVCGDAQVYGDAKVYGDAWVYGNARVCGDARVYGDARVCGDAQVYGGTWDKSPLYIQGTRWSVCVPSIGRLKIGCQDHTMEQWRENWKAIAQSHGAEDAFDEYALYYNLAAARYGYPLITQGE